MLARRQQTTNGEPMKRCIRTLARPGSGFTLIEMLVVIAIAAIIIAITLSIAHGAIKMIRSFQ